MTLHGTSPRAAPPSGNDRYAIPCSHETHNSHWVCGQRRTCGAFSATQGCTQAVPAGTAITVPCDEHVFGAGPRAWRHEITFDGGANPKRPTAGAAAILWSKLETGWVPSGHPAYHAPRGAPCPSS